MTNRSRQTPLGNRSARPIDRLPRTESTNPKAASNWPHHLWVWRWESPLTHLFDDEVCRFVLRHTQRVSGPLKLRTVVVEIDDRHANVDASRQRRMTSVGTDDDRDGRRLHFVVKPSSCRQFVLARHQLAELKCRRRRAIFQPTSNLHENVSRSICSAASQRYSTWRRFGMCTIK